MNRPQNIKASCLICGREIRRRGAPFIDIRELNCMQCGGFARRVDDRERQIVSHILRWILALLVAMIVIALFESRPSHADVIGQMQQDLVEQARAASAAEGDTGRIECFQVRRHGKTSICITLEQWRRMHADDRTALPKYRVGMRL